MSSILQNSMNKRNFIVTGASLAAATVLTTGCTTTGGASSSPAERRQAIDSSADAALTRLYREAPGSQEIIAASQGTLIFPAVVSAGFIIGGSHGQGVMRKAGKSTGYYRMNEASLGLLGGAQSQALFLSFMTEASLNSFLNSRGWTVGVDGTQFVTARGWEDLSNLLDTYEQLGLQADEDLIKEYIQHPKIAEDFSAYLDLYYKYRDDYGVEEILAGQAKPAVFARLLQAPFDERLSLVSLLLAGLNTRFAASRQADAVADACYAFLRETKKALATLPDDLPDGSAELFSQQIADYDAETQHQRDAGLLSHDALTTRLQVQAVLRRWEGELRRANAAGTQEAFELLRGQFQTLADDREKAQQTASAALEAAFDFMEQAFAESQEMVVFVTELTVNPVSHAFLTENGCERYFQYNKDLLLDHRKAALQQELAAEQRRHGGM